jgi:hypothetical protein
MRRSGSSLWFLVVIHLVAGHDPRLGWTAVVLLLTASLLGATMFLPWWSRGCKGLYGDHDPAGFYPAEDHSGWARCTRMVVSLT